MIDIDLPPIVRLERQGGGADAIAKAADLLSKAKFPVILSGAPDKITGNFALDNKSAALAIASAPPPCLSNLTIGGRSMSIT